MINHKINQLKNKLINCLSDTLFSLSIDGGLRKYIKISFNTFTWDDR